MKQLFILLTVIFFSYTSDAQVRVIKMDCVTYDNYIKDYCFGCSLSQSNFNGIMITENKVKTYLWHPIKVVTNGGIVSLTDAFGTTFRGYASQIVGLNSLKNVLNFINTCAGTPSESKGAVVSANYSFAEALEFLVQSNADPVKFTFVEPVYTGADTTAISVLNAQDFTIKKAGTYKIDYNASFIPTLTGQYFIYIYKNGVKIAEQVAHCSSIVTGYINTQATYTTALEVDDIISMYAHRPSGAVTYTVYSSNLTITKL